MDSDRAFQTCVVTKAHHSLAKLSHVVLCNKNLRRVQLSRSMVVFVYRDTLEKDVHSAARKRLDFEGDATAQVCAMASTGKCHYGLSASSNVLGECLLS